MNDSVNQNVCNVKWHSNTKEKPLVNKDNSLQFNVIMINKNKNTPYVTSLYYLNEYRFYDEDDFFLKDRDENGYVSHTGWVLHLNDEYFESIDDNDVLYWAELPKIPDNLF